MPKVAQKGKHPKYVDKWGEIKYYNYSPEYIAQKRLEGKYQTKAKRFTQGPVLVYKNGKINEERVNQVISEFYKKGDVGSASDVRAIVESYSKKKIRDKSLRLRSLISRVETDGYRKMLINAGYDPDTAYKHFNMPEKYAKEILNPKNWKGNQFSFTDPDTGKTYRGYYKHDYYKESLIEIEDE